MICPNPKRLLSVATGEGFTGFPRAVATGEGFTGCTRAVATGEGFTGFPRANAVYNNAIALSAIECDKDRQDIRNMYAVALDD